MVERVIVITGATDGLGRALSASLAAQAGLTLVAHGRSQQRLDTLAAALADASANVLFLRADFSELAQVRRMAEDIGALTDHVSVLVNNAGIGAGAPDGTGRELSVDGNELRLAVNHLAAFALTQDLLPLLKRGAPARIVNVASIGQSPIDLADPQLEHGYSGMRAYGQSKLAMIATGFALARTLDPRQVTVNSLHPATFMPTKMVLDAIGYCVDSLDDGLNATLRLILDPDLEGVSGEFFDHERSARAHADAYDNRIQQAIWDLSIRLTLPRHAR